MVEVEDVRYELVTSTGTLSILSGVSFKVEASQVVAIVGPSGSGKTSLLMLLAGLERPTSGSIKVTGQQLNNLTENQLALFRRKNVGIVFQNFHLIPSLSALDNVALALEIASPDRSLSDYRAAAAAALTSVGLGDRLSHRPSALSGGEQQRVGLARAMIAEPKLVLADEPTGNLDQATGGVVIELMFDLARRKQTTVVLVTHDPNLAARADRVFVMERGVLTETTGRSS